MTSYKAVQDSNREEFRKYLEKNGVMDTLTRCLVGLYEAPERPEDPLSYLRNTMGACTPEKLEVETLRNSYAEMSEKLDAVMEENKKLKERLAEASAEAPASADPAENQVADQTA